MAVLEIPMLPTNHYLHADKKKHPQLFH